MSIISNTHALVPFVSRESKPLSEQRLVKVVFMPTKNNKNPLQSVCASVPFISQEEMEGHIRALMPHIRTMLEGAQNGIIRSLYEGSKGLRKEVRQEEITVQACIGFMEVRATGGRLSAESIKAWFYNGLAVTVSGLIIRDVLKYGDDPESLSEEQTATVDKHLAAYCEVFQSLTGKGLTRVGLTGKGLTRAAFSEKKWARLTQILDAVTAEDPDDVMAQKLQERMRVIAEAVTEEDIL